MRAQTREWYDPPDDAVDGRSVAEEWVVRAKNFDGRGAFRRLIALSKPRAMQPE
jgi:hypothetical protein